DLFQLAHCFALRLLGRLADGAPPALGAPLRWPDALPEPPLAAGALPPPFLAPSSRAFFTSRLFCTSVLPGPGVLAAGLRRASPGRPRPAGALSDRPSLHSHSILRSSRSTRMTFTSTLSPRRKLRPLRSPARR